MGDYILRFLIVLHLICCVYAKSIQSLNGSWIASDASKVYKLEAHVPGGIYTDMMYNKLIEDVFYRQNDIKSRWISKMDWTYVKEFKIKKKFKKFKNINLIFDGVDTFSEIYLNGDKIGTTDNMFVKYIFDIKSKLKNKNILEVKFHSAVKKAKKLFKDHTALKNYSVLPLCVPEEYNGECHVNHVRKMQASFSWEWGPALPSMGIWKNVYMEGYNDVVIRDITVKTTLIDNKKIWLVEVNVYLEGNSENDTIKGDITINLENDEITKQFRFTDQILQRNKDGEFLAKLSCNIGKDKVQLWWPNGHGKAKLYSIIVSYVNRGGSREKDSINLKIGYRTVKLYQNEIESGRKFYFEVNDVPIFAKGSNFIPISILPELGQNEEDVEYYLKSAKDVHMNMLRVWGGGVYESDLFYEIADRLGIMIWQDIMFACSMYPVDDWFLRSVKKEIKHQIRRLQYHPSIVVWSGNNENEVALRQNWYGTNDRYKLFKEDYITLYINTIKSEVLKNDDTRTYLVSSPSNGIQSEIEGYIAEHPNSKYYGDVHFFNYDNDGWDISKYPVSRFTSEYGYQSVPCLQAFHTATDVEEDLKMGSVFLNKRQHLPKGYESLRRLISYQLNILEENSKDYFEILIYYSQIVQAMSVKLQTELYRQWRCSITNNGEGFTMGALYWQLNDVWVAPTWSGIDAERNWKMLHHFAKSFFAPVIVTGSYYTVGFLGIYVVSDLKDEISDALLNIHVYRWDLLAPVHTETVEIDVLPLQSSLIKSFWIKWYFSGIKGEPCGAQELKNCFIYLTLISGKGKRIAPDNFVFPILFQQLTTIYSRGHSSIIKISNVKKTRKPGEFEIEITARKVALFVWLEIRSFGFSHFSENGFLQVTQKRTVLVKTEFPATIDEIREELKLFSIFIKDVENNSDRRMLCMHCFLVSLIVLIGIMLYFSA